MVAPQVVLLAAFAAAVVALTDIDILQYALTLEHLENAFYSGALQRFNASPFLTSTDRAMFTEISEHEATHVTVLKSVIGASATQPCNYSFPYNNVQGFKALAQIIEGVGVTAYLGAAQFIADPTVLTAAGAILSTEARHAAWLATANGADPWSGAFDTPLGFSQVFSLAAPFITSCPPSNPALPVKAFPALTASPSAGLKQGSNVTLSVPPNFVQGTNAPLFAAFFNGITTTFVAYTQNATLAVPVNSTGTIYAVITTSNSSATDDTTVAGPAILLADTPAGGVGITIPGLPPIHIP